MLQDEAAVEQCLHRGDVDGGRLFGLRSVVVDAIRALEHDRRHAGRSICVCAIHVAGDSAGGCAFV
jgi:hypothetical protein